MQRFSLLAFLSLIFCLGPSLLFGQMTGLWEVRQVKVGQEEMTPVAKWFDLREDQKLHSGNGGVQNMSGGWTFDQVDSQLHFTDKQGALDEMGAFSVKMESDRMIWEREEEGQRVTVDLVRIRERPSAPWDKIVGRWAIQAPDNTSGQKGDIFLRWDRVYVMTTGDSRHRGIWHIDGHRPFLRLLSDEGDDHDQSWDIHFSGPNQMIWRNKQAESEIILLRNN